MDKLKVFLAVMKKHHFWVMTGCVVILALLGWFMATSKLQAEFKKNKDKIESEFKDLKAITLKDSENQKWIDGLNAETKKLKKEVKHAWQDVYSMQRDEVLKWPAGLSEEFRTIVPKLGPNEDITEDLRDKYWFYIKEEFPRLLQIIDARNLSDKPQMEMSTSGQRPGNSRRSKGLKPAQQADLEPEHDYKVIWLDQNLVQQKLEEFENTPTSLEVRNTQEDLWVYQSLLLIIKKLNERATGHHNAKVKEIKELNIGHLAAEKFKEGMASGLIDKPAIEAKSGETGPGPDGAPALPSEEPGGRGGMGEAGTDDEEKRYVDEKGVPIAAPKDEGAGGAAPSEFKRMPVYMKLLIDQREISRLLVECANSPLPVEVRKFRLVGEKSGTSGGGSSRSSGPRGGVMMGRGGRISSNRMSEGSMSPRSGRGGGYSGATGITDEKDVNPYDVTIEVIGIISIFNPPDAKKFADVADEEAEGSKPEGGEAKQGQAEEPAAPRAEVQPADAPAEPAKAPEEKPAASPPEAAAESMPEEKAPEEK